MTNTTFSPDSLTKANMRFSQTNLLRLSDDMMPSVLAAMVLTARKAKIAIAKLSDKQVTVAVHTAREAMIKDEVPMLPGSNIPVAKAEAYSRAYEAIDAGPKAFTPHPHIAQIVKATTPKAKQVHTSHLHCSHASTKVARAKCRRDRKQA